VGDLPPINQDWLLDTGEILFDLRSALDHLAYQLHVRRFCKDPLPGKVEGVTQFPIYRKPDQFSKNFYRIEKLSVRDRTALRNFQPYITRRGKWEWHRYWLGILNDLHNFDKHRKLHVIASAQNASVTPKFDDSLGFESHPVWGPAEADGHVDSWTFSKAPPHLKQHGGVYLHVTVEYGDLHSPLADVLLNTLVVRVRQVIDRFADRF
jgi:hypothetical protein